MRLPTCKSQLILLINSFLVVGSVELAAVGVSASVFNLVSKLFNVPLLNVTTAFVAEEQAFITKGGDKPLYSGQSTLFIV